MDVIGQLAVHQVGKPKVPLVVRHQSPLRAGIALVTFVFPLLEKSDFVRERFDLCLKLRDHAQGSIRDDLGCVGARLLAVRYGVDASRNDA